MSRRHLIEAAVFALMLLIFLVVLVLLTQERFPDSDETGSLSGSFQGERLRELRVGSWQYYWSSAVIAVKLSARPKKVKQFVGCLTNV
jgi:hypothetical protein